MKHSKNLLNYPINFQFCHGEEVQHFNPYRSHVICFQFQFETNAFSRAEKTDIYAPKAKKSLDQSREAMSFGADPHHYLPISFFVSSIYTHLHNSRFSLFVFIFQTWIQSKSLIYEAFIWCSECAGFGDISSFSFQVYRSCTHD